MMDLGVGEVMVVDDAICVCGEALPRRASGSGRQPWLCGECREARGRARRAEKCRRYRMRKRGVAMVKGAHDA